VRAVVADHWSGLPEHRPDEAVWARLDAVLFDERESLALSLTLRLGGFGETKARGAG